MNEAKRTGGTPTPGALGWRARRDVEALARRWEAEAAQIRRDYPDDEDYAHSHGRADQLSWCASQLREEFNL